MPRRDWILECRVMSACISLKGHIFWKISFAASKRVQTLDCGFLLLLLFCCRSNSSRATSLLSCKKRQWKESARAQIYSRWRSKGGASCRCSLWRSRDSLNSNTVLTNQVEIHENLLKHKGSNLWGLKPTESSKLNFPAFCQPLLRNRFCFEISLWTSLLVF